VTNDFSHETADELLPWLANGTLTEEERTAVERHLSTCASCAQEIAWLHEVGAAMTELANDVPEARLSSLASVLEAVDRHERAKAEARSWLARQLDSIWRPSRPVVRLALAAQFILIVILGVALLVRDQREPSLTTLSGSTSAPAGTRLTVVFEPGTTEETMRKALLDVGGNVVSGPSVLGVYRVEIQTPPGDEAKVNTVIARLRAMAGVVRFAEIEP
jgi:anti-sigma factor RsiW